jgi:uncharacterized LabA/DUF88 family protein
MRVRVFIDFWNFSLGWKRRVTSGDCDWRALPLGLVKEGQSLLESMGVTEPLTLEETLVYASVDPLEEVKLKRWLTDTIDRMPSYRVTIRERKPQPKTIHCRHCKATFDHCLECGEKYMPRTEKGVDAAIVTDLLTLAPTYDIAILVTGDADFIPAVEYLQGNGSARVINASWAGHGFDLRKKCWGSFDIEQVAPHICR